MLLFHSLQSSTAYGCKELSRLSIVSFGLLAQAPNTTHHRARHVALDELQETRPPRSGACACWATPTVSHPTRSSCLSLFFIAPAAARFSQPSDPLALDTLGLAATRARHGAAR